MNLGSWDLKTCIGSALRMKKQQPMVGPMSETNPFRPRHFTLTNPKSGTPIPTDYIPIPRIPKYLGKLQNSQRIYIPIPTHFHGNIGIPMGVPKSQKFPTFQ